jgi:hypothetical protein
MITGQIPLPGSGMEGFDSGLSGINDMFSKIIAQRAQQEQTKRLHERAPYEIKHILSQINNANARNSRQEKLLGPRLQTMRDAHIAQQLQNDPEAMVNYLQKVLASTSRMGGGMPTNGGQQPQPKMTPGNIGGYGVLNEGGEPNGQAMPGAEQDGGMMPPGAGNAPGQGNGQPTGNNALLEQLRNNPIARAAIQKRFPGLFEQPKESPEQKRTNALQDKITLEQEKARIKSEHKAQDAEKKEFMATEKDLPKLRESVRDIDELIKLSKENPDMFGHSFMPDRYAKTTKNKNFGKWQNLISSKIAGLESKFSAKGNVLALKMAAQLKPSHAETQEVALGKLESMKREIQNQIKRSHEFLGDKSTTEQNVAPSEDFSQMSDDELRQIAGGG